MNWADAISLGAFACGGALNAMQRCVHPIVVIVCGLTTASFGGVIRDLLCQQRPWILHNDSGLYASSALAGATTFVVTTQYAPWPVGMLACIGVVVGVSRRESIGLSRLASPRSWILGNVNLFSMIVADVSFLFRSLLRTLPPWPQLRYTSWKYGAALPLFDSGLDREDREEKEE